MTFVIKKSGCLLIPCGSANQLHLHVIVTDECEHSHLLVNFCSIKEGIYYDPTCVVRGEDAEHEFLKHDSYVAYGLASQRLGSNILYMVEKGVFIPKNDLADDCFSRVRDGIKRSQFTRKWTKDFYDKALREEKKKQEE